MTLPDTPTLLVERDGGVLRVTLNRPESRNALSLGLLKDLNALFDALRVPGEVRVLVLRGAGGNFCAGADLKEMMAGGIKPLQAGEPDPIAAYNRSFGTLLRACQSLPCVTIAVCEGAVLGGGFGFACVSDIALAHVDAKFGMPETTRGLPPAQIAPFVVERIGLTAARRLCLTGAQFRGADARTYGIVHDTFATDDELQSKLGDAIRQVLSCAPHANAVTKQIILEVARMDMDAVLDDAAEKFAACVRGPEAPEGIAAFMQKRKPKWAN